MLRAVLDTNIFISGIKSQKASPGQVLDAWKKKQFIVVTSPQLIEEVHEVLMRPAILDLLKQTPDEISVFIKLLIQKTFVTDGKLHVNVLKNDPDDNIIIATALEGQASHIVTGDNKSLLPLKEYRGIRILQPKNFLSLLPHLI